MAGSGTALPDRRMTSDVPQPSAVARMILAHHGRSWDREVILCKLLGVDLSRAEGGGTYG